MIISIDIYIICTFDNRENKLQTCLFLGKMRLPGSVRYSRPPTLRADYPLLFGCYCVRATGFQRTCASPVMCNSCYEKIGSPAGYHFAEYHRIIHDVLPDIVCNKCKEKIHIYKRAVDCNECFCKFMNIMGALRKKGYNLHDITVLHYDIEHDKVVRLYLRNPNEVDKDRMIKF